MSPLMIVLAIWLGSAVLVLIGGLWLVFRYPVEGERSSAEDLAVDPTEHVATSPSQSGSAPIGSVGTPETAEVQSRKVRSRVMR